MTPAQRRSAASRKAARSRKRTVEARARIVVETPTRITKSARILALLAEGKSRAEVAVLVGCKTAYVRAVIERHNNPWPNNSGARYLARKVAADPNFLRDRNDKQRRRYRTDAAYADRIRQMNRESYARRKAVVDA